MGGIKATRDGVRAAIRAIITFTRDRRAIRANDKDGVGLMLFGIRSQLTFLVIMLVSSTGFTVGFVCVYTHM